MKKSRNKIAFLSGIAALAVVCLMGPEAVFASPGGTTPMAASVGAESPVLPVVPSGKSFIHNPTTFTNPISLTQGSERVLTSGEPVVKLFNDDYYLFIRGRLGYWWSHDFKDWTYVDAPNLLGGIVGIVEIDGKLYNYAGNTENRVRATDDPKTGIWYDVGTFSSSNYGDATMLYDQGRLYMYYGWSQLLGIRVVELDKKTFKEIGKPVVCFWGDPHNHGCETRYASDLIYPLFTDRQYLPQEYGWTEGPYPYKYNGKYYLMFASIGLEFYSYGHGVYVADNPLGPYVYDEHNPLTLKTTGVAPGAGHGSIFQDRHGKFWAICMLPYAQNGGKGNTLISIFPADVDADGVMYGNVEYGDYPQYLPGVKQNPIKDDYTGWTLLSLDKRVETSSIYDWHLNYWPAYAVNEDPKTYWSAKTGDPGEYITVDLGEVSDIRGIQILWDSTVTPGTGQLTRYQSYTVEVSDDNQNWTPIIDKSNNPQDLRSDYTELPTAVSGRYVKLTNMFTPDNGRFAVKAFRVFGNPEKSTFTKVDNVTVVRSESDRRKASLVWKQVDGADGYVVRYGIEPNKLYNSYMVYRDNYLDIKSLNVDPEYYFEVEAFSSGTPRYVENTFATRGRGAEINWTAPTGVVSVMDSGTNKRFMTYESPNKEDEVYSLINCTPGSYSFTHAFGVGIWPSTALTAEQLTGAAEGYELSTVYPNLSQFGIGEQRWGSIEVRVYRGQTSGRVDLVLKYDRPGEYQISAVARDGSTANVVTSAMTGIRVGEETDGRVNRIVYTLQGGTFANPITPADFAVSGLPEGLAGTVERTSDTTVTVHIGGTIPATAGSIGSYKLTIPATVARGNVAGAGAGADLPVIVSPLSITVAIGTGAKVDAPTASSVTGDTITVNPVADPVNGQTVEYAINTSTTAPTTGWGTATTFTGRTSGTTYYAWARAAQNNVYSAGTAVRSAAIIAGLKGAGATVDAPTYKSHTNDTITVNPVDAPGNGQTVEYAINTSGATTPTTGWGTATTFTNCSPNTSYYVWARAAENDGYSVGTAVRSDLINFSVPMTLSLPIGPTGKDFIHNPNTYTNPISLTQGTGAVLTSGEPIIRVFHDYYILTVRGRTGYWVSDDFVDWTYIAAPSLRGGIPGFVEIDGKLYNYAGNADNNVMTTDDPKSGVWYQAGNFSSSNYGDASMLYDEESGRLFMYYGWSQILGIRVVELDKKTFKEIGEPVVAIWGDPHNHGWETRWASDNIFPLGSITREYRPQEYGWTEGGHPLKYKGKYYLMFASIGLEFFSYGHGVYVADDPLGPYVYSENNPLTMKTTGVVPGAGHGSIFLDKQGKVWTVCMLPYALNRASGNTLISLFPTDVDADGVMHGKVEYGDYPQYLPGKVADPIKDNYTGWTLLTIDKRVEASSMFTSSDTPPVDYWPAYAVDEDPKNYWCAKTGNPGEYITADLGEVSDIRGIQILWDKAGGSGSGALTRYQSYTVEVSNDNRNWTLIIDKSNNPQDLRSDYIELPTGVSGRYVKLTNVFTPYGGRFAVKALRAFGNPKKSTFTKVDNVTAVRSKLDRRFASVMWQPVDGADGYVVRYGIEPNKLYNSYTVYRDNYLHIRSLNVDPEYYFEVEAFSSGTPRYVENTFETRGRGAELDLVRQPTGGTSSTDRAMTYETYGKDEVYVFNNITPGTYNLRHTYGVGIWGPQQLTADQLIGTGTEPTVTALNLSQFGIGTTLWGTVEVRVYPGETSGRIEVTFKYTDTPTFTDGGGNTLTSLSSETLVTKMTHLNESDKAENLTMYVAVYSPDGKLIHLGKYSKEIAASETAEFEATLNMPKNADSHFATDGYYAKVFLWDSSTYAPVLAAYTFK